MVNKLNPRNKVNDLINLLEIETDSCIEFHFRKSTDGYSRIRIQNKQILAHRFSYSWQTATPIESMQGLVVMHSCDNPCCINIAHLSLGTWGR